MVSIKSGNPATVSKLAQMPSALPEIQPTGAHWGTYTASQSPAYVQNIGLNNAKVHAEGTEIRTAVYSTTGEMKLSTNIDLAVFEIGTEFGAGFTISSAENTYNQYKLDGAMSVQLSSTYYEGEPPMFYFTSSLKCLQWGILRNY
ncbi:hypothetical protein [Filimonas effusa]|uniref:Uncharacterized protein n=1 Tax=Filimonas effusa TaxID=2508721 RepID=A0A4V1MA24_9BACT|nr:hypothetical protein [Filimonas effusa]RXK83684.1 hypothetical protein ESB13_16520 [Filimonas effusa]